ncbi:MAG TPA: HD domain-containing protein [Bacteroidales bacterium]|nr:HD domain-containing protein [Bacteroidales bacterium]
MKSQKLYKAKIINDPIYGFIKIPSRLVYELIEHPLVQRLRRIKQLGLTYYVYPGATHTRFQHALGAVYLMDQAIHNLRLKGLEITDVEAEAVLVAILLHDIGHGPFSHALEESIIPQITHEDLSALLMQKLNEECNGKLELALRIFDNRYGKKFLHQLVSSQLDMDRLDYLRRDSFFTGVTEGVIGSDRIIKMLDVVNDQLVVEAKGIYSIEKFLVARRLMYWQVYFHKTVIAAEFLLVKLLQRAKELTLSGVEVYGTAPLDFFLKNKISKSDMIARKDLIIENFVSLDDDDLMVSAKAWTKHTDAVLSLLAKNLINRILPKIRIQKKPFEKTFISQIRKNAIREHGWPEEYIDYIVYADVISNKAYSQFDDRISILYNNGEIEDIAEASDIFNLNELYKTAKKYFLCYPKNCGV